MRPPRSAFRSSCVGSGLSIGAGATPQGPRRLLVERAMRAVVVVVGDVLRQHPLEMIAPENREPIGTLSSDGAHESLGECARSWRSNGCLDDLDALGSEHLVETGRELRVSVPDEERDCPRSSCEIAGWVSGLLDHPLPCRVRGDPGEIDPSGADLDKEQHVEASEQDRVDGEEVAGEQSTEAGSTQRALLDPLVARPDAPPVGASRRPRGGT